MPHDPLAAPAARPYTPVPVPRGRVAGALAVAVGGLLLIASPFVDWLVYNVEAAAALPDAYFIAVDGDRFVGCSSVRRSSEDQLEIGITAVLPAYRRRGIARLLKLRVHDWARRNGYREIHTSTTGPNVGILRLNESLGYVVVGSWGGYELRFSR